MKSMVMGMYNMYWINLAFLTSGNISNDSSLAILFLWNFIVVIEVKLTVQDSFLLTDTLLFLLKATLLSSDKFVLLI